MKTLRSRGDVIDVTFGRDQLTHYNALRRDALGVIEINEAGAVGLACVTVHSGRKGAGAIDKVTGTMS